MAMRVTALFLPRLSLARAAARPACPAAAAPRGAASHSTPSSVNTPRQRGPLRYEVWDFFKERWPLWRVSKTATAGGAVLLSGAAVVLWFGAAYRSSPAAVVADVVGVFEAGGAPGWHGFFLRDNAPAVGRPGLEKKLAEYIFLGPQAAAAAAAAAAASPLPPGAASDAPPGDDPGATYALVVGAHGTGKSTAVRRVVRNREGINGAVYVPVPGDVNMFGVVVGEAVGVPAGRRLGPYRIVAAEPNASWATALEFIKAAAIKFHEKHGRPVVLIIDGVERIAEQNPLFLHRLQGDAHRAAADCGALRVVLVASDGGALAQLKSHSAWSRACEPFEVGDISDEDAVEFLKSRGVPDKAAAEAVSDCTGGRLVLLHTHAARRSFGSGNKEVLKDHFRFIKEQLRNRVKVPRDHALFRALVERGAIGADEAAALASADALDALVKAFILSAHHPQAKAYTFHSRYVETFFKGVFAAEGRGRGGG
jgi:hypothetical protein